MDPDVEPEYAENRQEFSYESNYGMPFAIVKPAPYIDTDICY
jgi:hypothetical protein